MHDFTYITLGETWPHEQEEMWVNILNMEYLGGDWMEVGMLILRVYMMVMLVGDIGWFVG